MYCKFDSEYIVKLFESFRVDAHNLPVDGVTDYFGTITPIQCAPYLSKKAGTQVLSSPYPHDTLRGGFIECLAVAESVKFASDSIYQMIELGASYAPFTAIAAKMALNKGMHKIILSPVEVAKKGIDAIALNIKANDLNREDISINIINKAVGSNFGTMYFPDVDCTVDNGGATSVEKQSLDYRGKQVNFVEVECIPLQYVLEHFNSESIDLIHIDVQGAEEIFLPDSIAILNQRVKRVMVATHSRAIEGLLLELFHRNGWLLVAEEQTDFKYRINIQSFTGMTSKDGAQYRVNIRQNMM